MEINLELHFIAPSRLSENFSDRMHVLVTAIETELLKHGATLTYGKYEVLR